MAIFSTLEIDVYKLSHQHFAKQSTIPHADVRLLSTAVSNSCIIYDNHFVYDEFSTANLISVEFHKSVHAVSLTVKKILTFVRFECLKLYLKFGSETAALRCYDMLAKHVHKFKDFHS
ncbi:hypothetical protein FO519_001787 [Halicephalobus sp. NKZ332]|nr:hypothetical protein FO519_001787 [Halicephalobus sp. NKZ332]